MKLQFPVSEFYGFFAHAAFFNELLVSAEELGDSWPLTVPNGYIYKREASHGRSEVVFVAPDGREYGLNGTALSAGYSDIHHITKSRSVFGDPRYEDVSGLIRIGLNGK